jgi:hypothetical protein
MNVKQLSKKYALPTHIDIVGDPSTIFAKVVIYCEENGEIVKLGDYAVKASFVHPDGQTVLVNTKIFRDDTLYLECQRIRGDVLLFALIWKSLNNFLVDGKVSEFKRGDIVPVLPMHRPAVDDGVISDLDIDIFSHWAFGKIKDFFIDHAELSHNVTLGKVTQQDFQHHLERIPKIVSTEYKLAAVEPSTRVCERVDELMTEAVAYWALRGVE